MISIDEPMDFSPEQSAWLRRLISIINQEASKDVILNKSSKLPVDKYSEGTLRYFTEAVLPDITAPGLYYYGKNPADLTELKWNKVQTV